MKEKREEVGKDGKQCEVTYNHIATALQQTSYEKCASKDPRKEGRWRDSSSHLVSYGSKFILRTPSLHALG